MRATSMTRWLTGALLFCASLVAAACPLCIGAYRQSPAQDLTSLRQAVLAVPTADRSTYRVVEVIKGERPSNGVIEEGSFKANAAAPGSGKPLLLVRDASWPMWVSFGTLGAEHASWLRELAAGKRWPDMNADEWRARVALMLPYLESPEQMVAGIAYDEFASAPYAALRTLKPRLDAPKLRRWIDDPRLAQRQSALHAATGDCWRRNGCSSLRAADRCRVEGQGRDQPRSHARRGSGAARSLADGLGRRQVHPRSQPDDAGARSHGARVERAGQCEAARSRASG